MSCKFFLINFENSLSFLNISLDSKSAQILQLQSEERRQDNTQSFRDKYHASDTQYEEKLLKKLCIAYHKLKMFIHNFVQILD